MSNENYGFSALWNLWHMKLGLTNENRMFIKSHVDVSFSFSWRCGEYPHYSWHVLLCYLSATSVLHMQCKIKNSTDRVCG